MNLRTNWRNDGRDFEAEFKQTCDAYRRQGILRMEKVGPPARVMGGGSKERRVIFMENPFADWMGVWTERGRTALLLETKSTAEPKLQFGSTISDTQIEWLIRWAHAGMVTGVVWRWTVERKTVFIPIGLLHQVHRSGRRHLKFDEGDPIGQGLGFCLLDFAANLRRWYDEAGARSDPGTLAPSENRA